MPFKIVRNDITRVAADAIVNTANPEPTYGSGTDAAVYKAAGEEELLAARKKIGRITPEGIFKDITTFGLLFESLVIHDLRVYADTIGARVYKYRDGRKREADAVIQFRDGSWALIEVKLGGEDDILQASKNLLSIAGDIDEEKTGKPAFLMVVTKNKVAYRMKNGVYAVPLCCLKP